MLDMTETLQQAEPAKRDTQAVHRRGLADIAAEMMRRRADGVMRVKTEAWRRVLRVFGRNGKTADLQVRVIEDPDPATPWQAYLDDALSPAPARPTFWVLVDRSGRAPEFYVIPERWMRTDIRDFHANWLQEHGVLVKGKIVRPKNPTSRHHAIRRERVAQWRGRWDLLDIGLRADRNA